jgi:hypothetical protein
VNQAKGIYDKKNEFDEKILFDSREHCPEGAYWGNVADAYNAVIM